MQKPQNSNGFTFIEMSMVLVVVGLIVGGVLVGVHLVRTAKVNGTLNQLANYKASTAEFKTKFNCIPGDCEDAYDKGLGTSGDGDGIVASAQLDLTCANPVQCYASCGSVVAKESALFWVHLDAAGLVPLNGDGDTCYAHPRTTIGNGAWVIMQSARMINSAFRITEKNDSSHFVACGGEIYCPALSPQDSFYIDSKIDDGLPDSGDVVNIAGFTYQAQGWTMSPAYEGAAGANNSICVVTGATNEYNVQNINPNLCLLEFIPDF